MEKIVIDTRGYGKEYREMNSYLKLFNNYERRFKQLTILVPLELYNRYKSIFEDKAIHTGFIKYGEMSDIVVFRNWSE